jgi:ABC-type multidrug transport system permease subunit
MKDVHRPADAGASRDARPNPLVQLVLARLREFTRQLEAVFWVYVFPVIMMVALGIAFRSRNVDTFDVDVVDGPLANSIRAALEADERFQVQVGDERTSHRRLRGGKTDVVVAARSTPNVMHEYFYDPTKPGSLLARDTARDVLQRAAGRVDIIKSHDHELTEPGGRYIDFLVPGLIGMGLMGGGLWGVGFAIVDLRIRKLLKRYLATPMKKSHFLGAMMISRLLFTVTECVFVLIVARLLFGVVNHGSYWSVSILITLGAIEFAGIGLLVASRAQTLETVSGLMNLVMLPMWIASGIFYSIERFPSFVQPILKVLPLTPLIDGLRSVMQDGASLGTLWLEIVICIAWGIISFLLALRWFRWS